MIKKIKLRFELVFLMVISLVLSLIVVFFIRNHGFAFKENNKETRIERVRNECVDPLEKILSECDLTNQDRVNEVFQEQYKFLVGYNFYLVNADGSVIVGTDRGIHQLDQAQIYDGCLEYEHSTKDRNVFRINGCDHIKDQYYLYFTFFKYDVDDTKMLFTGLLGALLLFFLFIWGRVSYISTIRASVGKIADGDLRERVPLQYKNELKDLAVDINQMAASLESEEHKKNEFLTNISHDIRTPLTTLLGYLDMVRNNKYDSKEQMQDYLDVMERKGKFLSSMLEDFFQYSKLDSGDIVVNRIPFEINELLRQFYEDEVDEFEQKSLKLKTDLYPESLPYNGDPQLLARVVANLMSNALKYSKDNSVVLLKSGLKKQGGEEYLHFSVSNIPKKSMTDEELAQLFDRLYKRDSSRNEEGSGLGLAIVKNIVRLHDGKVGVYEDGQRLVFQVLLRRESKQ